MDFETGNDLIALKEALEDVRSEASDCASRTMEADEYARWNGLTIDSLFDPLPRLVNHDGAISATADDVEPGCLFEVAWLEECLFRTIIPTPEQWQLPAPSLHLLQKACKLPNEQEVAALMTELCFSEVSAQKRLKFEIPALRSDHDADCRHLARTVKEFQKDRLPEHDIPPFSENNREDGGLDFPKSAKEGDEAMMKQFQGESLEMKRESLVFLMRSLKADWTDSDQEEMFEHISIYKGIGAREHLTPPLSPLVQPLAGYFIPDDDDCQIPEPSEAGSMLSADIEAAESRILEEDFNFWNSVATERPSSPERYDDLDIPEMIRAGELSTHSPFASPRPLPRGLKVDVPLFIPEDDAEWQHARARVLDPEDLAKARAFVDSSSDPLSGTADGLDHQFSDFISAKAEYLTRSAEQEKLQPLDALARISVPVVDFSMPATEWGDVPLKPTEMFKWIQDQAGVGWSLQKWPWNKTTEQMMMWQPLAHMDKPLVLSEAIEIDKVVLESLLAGPKDSEVVTSVDSLVKRSELLLTKVRESDDSEIESEDSQLSPVAASGLDYWPPPADCKRLPDVRPGNPLGKQIRKTSVDPGALPKGRKRIRDEMLQQQRPSSQLGSRGSDFQVTRPIDASILGSTNVLQGFMSEYTNIMPLLENFEEMNTHKKPKVAPSRYFNMPDLVLTSPIQEPQPAVNGGVLMPPPLEPILAVAPNIVPPNIPPRVIVSSTISRVITNLVKSHIPGIGILEHDYNKRRPTGWFPGIRSPNSDEADMTISPATGVLVTTMVKLRQKPLPGVTGQVVFRHVVENVALRYEHLLILVSEGNKNSEIMIPLSQSDAKALAEFQGYAAGLQTDIRLHYVGGGNETLAKWLAAAICKHAPEAVPVQDLLLPVETGWELFLRRAGMNVYAAQITLGTLKVPNGELAVGGGRLYGLPLFVTMEPHERVAALEDVLGGRRVLGRVSEALDEPWGQLAVSQVREAVGRGGIAE